jgi:hypothetical protein
MSNNPLAILDARRNGVAVRQRLQWMDDRLWWVGVLNRSDLMIRFGISPPQSTNDFSLYQELAPNNIKYDPKRKLYFCRDDFVPLFPKDHELWLKESTAENQALQTIQLIGLASVKRGIDPTLVQVICRSVRNKTPLRILYQSMKASGPEERIVSPHAIVQTDVRWHVRAWDEKRQTFLDLVPSRIIRALPEPSVAWVPQEQDEQWNRMVNIILIPSRKLSKNQRWIAEEDYQMSQGRRILEVRACMVCYQLSALYLVDAVRYHEGQPEERDFGIAVENWKELQPLVMEMR